MQTDIGKNREFDTLVDLLRARAQGAPPDCGYTFLTDGESQEAVMSYADLDQRARTIAGLLLEAGGAGQRALLLYPPGLDYIAAFFGCLYAGAVPVPAYPPDPSRLAQTLPRLEAMAVDAQARFVLTTKQILGFAGMLASQAPTLAGLDWKATDGLDSDLSAGFQAPDIHGGSIAFLQYTSGSTGTPRGAVVTHANLLHNSGVIGDCFEHGKHCQGVIWLPPYHDMGLIGGILQPLYQSFPVTLLSPIAFLKRPLRWLRAISRYRATTSGGPNFAFDLCVRRAKQQDISDLDLSTWDVAFNGAEPIRAETVRRFVETFGPCGFREEAFLPCYGLAEATLFVTGAKKTQRPLKRYVDSAALARHEVVDVPEAEGRTLISSGGVWRDHQVAIVDPETLTLCAEGTIGEIWVSGASVVEGYWARPEETKEAFSAKTSTGLGPYLRTGDLGFADKGELYVTGRLKDLIIMRGKNYYPHDIESTVEKSHLAVRPGRVAAFAVDAGDSETLVVVCELRSMDLNTAEICERIDQAICGEHGLRSSTVAVVEAGEIPKTSSGKLQRGRCRVQYLAGELRIAYVHGSTPPPSPMRKRAGGGMA